MTLLEDAATEQIAPIESLYDSLPIAPVDILSPENVKAQELRLYWRYRLEATELLRQPLTYKLMQQIYELSDDIEVIGLHTESPALRRKIQRQLEVCREWKRYNTRPYQPHRAPKEDPMDAYFNRALMTDHGHQ